MTKPLGMLTFSNAQTGDKELVEVSEIQRITDYASTGEGHPRSAIRLKDGQLFQSNDNPILLAGEYHDIIRGTPPGMINAVGID